MFTPGRIVWVCVAVAPLLFAASAARSQTAVASNLDVMGDLAGRVVDRLLSEFPRHTTPRELRLVPVGTDESYAFVENVFVKSLTSKGYRAYTGALPGPSDSASAGAFAPSPAPSDGLHMEFQVVDFTLRYPKVYRSHLVGGKKVKRSAAVRLFARLVEPANGLVVWTGEAAETYDDVFEYGALAQVESGLYQFTKPPRESRKWGKVVEPVAVSGIIVGLIYLFFSNQGD